ncbi:DUF4489 domain-containing protein [Vallitalea okinawensis]|uniref:DUF4489 domain-containing protein n=1 Tax=Vallitalea okinawensis TaxID=2078660 RepID=UPI000CFBC669|nr:DUF4489 domain-containing protein [Vallitalea okinawensis]
MILLECGEGTGSRTFISAKDMPFQLTHVNLDTSYINGQDVLIKFSSLVLMEAFVSGATVRLQYELLRVCGNEDPVSIGTWMFEEVGSAPVVFESQEESFSFIFCESINCSQCCEYFVRVTPLEITGATTTVSNGRIAALSNTLNVERRLPKAKDILLVCGQENGSAIFRQATVSQPPVNVAHVAIDTSCLTGPKILIEFSSVIESAFRVQDVRLEFELFRVCDDKEALSRGIWTFERKNTAVPSAIDNTFTFVFCDDIPCTGCCEYFVTVRAIELIVGAPAIYLGVTVDHANLVAIAQLSDSDVRVYGKSIENKGKKTLMECGSGTGSKVFTSSSDSAFQLAHTTIDTTCLCKPIVNIEFSSILSFQQLVDQGRAQLRYELFRVCDNREPMSIGVWIVGWIDFRIIDRSTGVFDFTYCDCKTCVGCCDYFVEVTPIELTDGLITATVSNGRMAALAQSS